MNKKYLNTLKNVGKHSLSNFAGIKSVKFDMKNVTGTLIKQS